MFSVQNCDRAMCWSWTTSARTRSPAYASESQPVEQNCSISHPTRQTSTPSRKPWAKLKQLPRTAKARTAEALQQAIAELLPEIRPQDAQAWFTTPFYAL